MPNAKHSDLQLWVASQRLSNETWDTVASELLAERWILDYKAMTPWETDISEIRQGQLTYLFDAAPTMHGVENEQADDRVVAVWGRSVRPVRIRDRSRLAGFLPNPLRWSNVGVDRGHLVAHTCGGGDDLNLFPQAAGLNRGRSVEGRLWRKMESYAATRPGTPLFVRPIYTGPTWKPDAIDYGVLLRDRMWIERFANVD